MSTAAQLILIKLGGSLITDKAGIEAIRLPVLRRLAAELRAILDERPTRIVLGHGSGSFGHVAASRGGWTPSGVGPTADSIARTQDAAARLNRAVMAVLLEAGLAAFSLAPGSMMTCRRGRLAALSVEPLTTALEAGLVPVTFGDVVLDSEAGARIFSTEGVFLAIVPALLARGYKIAGAYWLGTTDGVLDPAGRPIAAVGFDSAQRVLAMLATGDAGDGVVDVTGGMRHRLEAALALARLGVPSWILDGRSKGALGRALAGGKIPATWVHPGA